MSDPISDLQRKEQEEFTRALGADATQNLKPVRTTPAVDSTPMPPAQQPTPDIPLPPAINPNVQQQPLYSTEPALQSLQTLGDFKVEQPSVTGQVATSGVLPAETIRGAVAPQLERELTEGRKLQQRAANETAAATQAAIFPELYAPPSLEALDRERQGSYRWAMQDNMQRMAEAQRRQDQQALEWEQYKQQALEFLRSKEGQQGSTGGAFDWLKDIAGTKDGQRTYLQPFNKDRGWSLPATLLYGLGIVQNTGVGAALDIRTLTNTLANATPPWARPDAMVGRLPGWAQGFLRSADIAASQGFFGSSPLSGGAQALVTKPGRGLFESLYGWATAPGKRLNDGRSNTIEALRGAQYSFMDKQGDGVGINNDRAVRIGAAPGKGFGFDFNPSVVAGFGLDVIAGNRADRILDTGRIIFSPVRGVWRKLRGERLQAPDVPTVNTPPKPSSGGSGGAARQVPTIPPGTPSPARQLELPFLPGRPSTVKAKPISVAQAEQRAIAQAFDQNAEAIAAFRKANQREAKRIAAIRKAADSAQPQQLELKLDDLPTVNLTATTPRVKPVVKQLTLDLGELSQNANPVQATRETLAALPKTGDPAADAYLQARVVNELLANTDAAVKETQLALDLTPDVGRKFTVDGGKALDVVAPPDLKLPLAKIPTETFHGTRVRDLDLTTADPIAGAARSELGTGHYLTTDINHARTAASAISAENLPPVAGREIAAPTVIPTTVKLSAKLIDALAESPEVSRIADVVAQQFDDLADLRYGSRPVSLRQVYDDVSAVLDEADALTFQRTMGKTLREAGYDGAAAGRTLSIYNPQAIIQRGARQAVDESAGVLPKLAARAELEAEAVADTGSQFSRAASADADARLAAQADFEAEQLADEVAKRNVNATDDAGLWDDPVIKALPGSNPNAPRLNPTSDPELNVPLQLQDKLGTPMAELPPTVRMRVNAMLKGIDDLFEEWNYDAIAKRVDAYEFKPQPLPDLSKRTLPELPDLKRLTREMSDADKEAQATLADIAKQFTAPTATEQALREVQALLPSAEMRAQAVKAINALGEDFTALSAPERVARVLAANPPNYDVAGIRTAADELDRLLNVDTSKLLPQQYRALSRKIDALTDKLDEMTKQSPCGL